MKIVRHSIAAFLVSGFLIMLQGTSVLAGEGIRSGMIREISTDHSEIVIGANYYHLDSRTVIHAPMGKSRLSPDKLNAGLRVGFRAEQTADGGAVPRLSEIWVYLD